MSRPRDNRERLVSVAVAGRVADARWHEQPLHMDVEGRASFLPGTGGIAFGVHSGDSIDGWVADHLMVGASIEDAEAPVTDPGGLHMLACIGNRARTAAGEPLGVIAGKRGGLAPRAYPPSLVSVEAPDARLGALAPGDRAVVEAQGRGLSLVDFEAVTVTNAAPRLLDALPWDAEGERLVVPVRAIVPSRFAGPGLGQDTWVGDLEIAGSDTGIEGVEGLRFGDLVAFADVDSAHDRFFRPGFVSIGLVSHGPSTWPGHGPGVTIVLSGPVELVKPELDPGAGVGAMLRQWGDER